MPIIERDQWRKQYFSDINCRDDIPISTDDRDSFELFPRHRWVYDKTRICKTQKILHAPYGREPPIYPVFSKPITNLRGMGIDSHKLASKKDYLNYCRPGHFWMEYLTGDHISSDAALINGKIVWQAHVRGITAKEGTFDHWHIMSDSLPSLENYYRAWLDEYLKDYTGLVNIESIGGKIIEVHLRVVDQWPDLYGPEWLKAVVALYTNSNWPHDAQLKRPAYSVVLFGPHGRNYAYPPEQLLQELKANDDVSSIQITFNDNMLPEKHAMPPGGFRLAVVNSYSLSKGRKTVAKLADFFGVPYSANPAQTSTPPPPP